MRYLFRYVIKYLLPAVVVFKESCYNLAQMKFLNAGQILVATKHLGRCQTQDTHTHILGKGYYITPDECATQTHPCFYVFCALSIHIICQMTLLTVFLCGKRTINEI